MHNPFGKTAAHRTQVGIPAAAFATILNGEGGIFDAHLLVLEDRTLLDEVIRNISEKKLNAEYASTITGSFAQVLTVSASVDGSLKIVA